jgi:hypothetical protein
MQDSSRDLEGVGRIRKCEYYENDWTYGNHLIVRCNPPSGIKKKHSSIYCSNCI